MSRRKKSERHRARREKMSAKAMYRQALRARDSYNERAARLIELAAEVSRTGSCATLEQVGFNPWEAYLEAIEENVGLHQLLADKDRLVGGDLLADAIDRLSRFKTLVLKIMRQHQLDSHTLREAIALTDSKAPR